MDKLQFVYTSEMRPVIRSQWGYQGTAYGCMNCGFGVIAPTYNYCPNCGAVMSDKVVGEIAPVNVVRCRDCKEWKPCEDGEFGTCNLIDGLWEARDFCSEGERREDAAAQWNRRVNDGNSDDT